MLSHHQKRDLSILARQAFELKRAAVLPSYELQLDGCFYRVGRLSPNVTSAVEDSRPTKADAQTTFLLRGDTASAGEWRHNEVAKACGKLGLRCCGQPDYNKVLAHFQRMLGHTAAANHATTRSATDGRRTAEFKIGKALMALSEQGGSPLGLSYANGICRKMFHGTALAEASDKQLWKVYFALNKQTQRQGEKTTV